MPQISRHISRHRHRHSHHRKCSVLRFIVIILSFISLMSRIIYCTYASWLVFTTFDCTPCSPTAGNDSSELFISHDSSAIFKAISGLNFKSTKSESKVRIKREVEDNYSSISSSDNSFVNDYYETKQKAANLTKEAFYKIAEKWFVSYNGSISGHNRYETTTKLIKNIANVSNASLYWNNSNIGSFVQKNSSYQSNTLFLSDGLSNDDKSNKSHTLKEDSENSFLREPNAKQNLTNKRSDNVWHLIFAYVPQNTDKIYVKEETVENMVNNTNENHFNISIPSDKVDKYSEISNISEKELDALQVETEKDEILPEDGIEVITMPILLNERELNQSANSLRYLDFKGLQNGLNDYQLVNDSSRNNMTKDSVNHCSEECDLFLSVELNDPKIRKWALILVTSVLYLYALSMLCILMGACFTLVDVLIIATFIEGAKLFVGFVLIIIDSFNGKQMHFNLIDVKFKVNPKGNGWTADFSYSEYLLDIIIFLFSTLLCIKVFKCFNKRCKKVSTIEY